MAAGKRWRSKYASNCLCGITARSAVIVILALIQIPLPAGATGLSTNLYDRCRGAAENKPTDGNAQTEVVIKSMTENDKKAEAACIAAEKMRRSGDYDATKKYEAAIKYAPKEPGYELLYGEYLRSFRGGMSRGMLKKGLRRCPP